MKLAFGTDWHLDFLNFENSVAFLKKINTLNVDGIILTGDITTGIYLKEHLSIMNRLVDKPIYFIHGNHDFFGSSFWEIRDISFELSRELEKIHWLECKSIQLTNKTAIFGVDGWYDGGYGDYFFSKFELMDFDLIKELKFKTKEERLKVFEMFADIGASGVRRELPRLFEKNDLVILATHVPPFTRLAKHNGNPTSNDALPYFCSRIIGEAIIEVKDKYPKKELLVLCGHTHSEAKFSLDNMNCICAPAKYSNPSIYTTIEIK